MQVLRSSLILAAAALALLGSATSAQSQSGKFFARYNKPIESVTLDLATGTLTRAPVVQDRAATTVADFTNIDLSGFSGIDTGGGFCEWFDAGVKGFAGNESDLMDSVVFSYCSAKLTPGSGGPGGSVKLGFWEGYTTGGSPSTNVATFTLTGLPGNSASSSFFGGFKCIFLRVQMASLVCFADGNIGYSWQFLDNGTGTINPLGATLAGTWPFMACVVSCSGTTGQVDAQGMTDMIDKYCPPGTLRTTFSFGTTSGSYTSMSMQIEEVTTKYGTIAEFNSNITPNPDFLTADMALVGQPWQASITLGLNRSPNNWIMFFGSSSSDLLIPQGSAGLNFGTNKAGRMLLSPRSGGGLIATPHTGVLGTGSTSSPVTIPKTIALVCNPWCAQAVVVGLVSSADGGGGVRLSSAVSGIVGTNPPDAMADFSGTPTIGQAPLTVHFTDLSIGLLTSWSWDFGDTGTSTLEDPVHTYTAIGTYTVTLTVSDVNGSDGVAKTGYITVTPPPPVADFSGAPLMGIAPLTVAFTDLSTGVATSWNWNFGDAGTSNLQNPSYEYTTPGLYAVTLTATGPGGSDGETKADYVLVNQPPPVAAFSASPRTGAAPLAVSFSDLSTGIVTSWSWQFGDTTTSSTRNPSHTYTSSGTYTVTLSVTGPFGMDSETKIGYVVVGEPPPVAQFSATPLTGNEPLVVAFSDLTTGAVNSWVWNFGDTGTSTLQNPSHTYTTAGIFTVTLTASGPGGSDGETKINYVVVGSPAPVANFSAAPLSGTAPLAVTFTDLTAGEATSWSWNFGDTTTSTLQDPVHTYVSSGTYTVTLIASGPSGSDGETKIGYVTVSEPPPVAEFSATPRTGNSPLVVAFTDLTTGAVTSWNWNFGDTTSSTQQKPVHTYTSAGTYTVTLTSTGPGGSDVETKSAYVVVSPPAPVANFSGTPLSGTAPLVVSFTDLSTGALSSLTWDFGDTNSSTLQNPVHTYLLPGTYTVTLNVTGPGGSDGETKIGYVVVTPPPPVADFSATPKIGIAPLIVAFTDGSTGAVSSWSWNFGDSGTSTLQNPGHTYATAGVYTVTLTATGAGGSDGEAKIGYITVNEPPPVAQFSGSPTSGISPLAVTFNDQSLGAVTSWSWNFGDAGTSTLQNPVHSYALAGTYTVSLTVTGPGGTDGDTKVGYIVVSEPPPVAEFSGTPLSGSSPLVVDFTDLSVGAVSSWSWNFGDTSTSTLRHPTHTYTAVGTYAVSLTVVGPGGSDGETKTAYVNVTGPGPVAEFSGTPLTGLSPLAVTFSDLSTGSVTAWAWNFGDSGTSTLQNPGHTYTAAGTYTVALTATGPGGSDVETKVGYVVVGDPAPVAEFSGTPLSGTHPLAVTFSDLSTGPVTAWAWNFGDTGTSTLQNPGHTYTAAGTYTVTLTATGPGGSDGETKVGYVVVSEPAPVAEFSGTPLSGTAPLAVTFSDLSTGPVTAWAWNFGDTGTSTLQNPSHTYTAAGTYTVTLTATGPGGSDGEVKVGYVVAGEPAPVAEFSGTPLTGTAPLAVTFSDLSTGSVTAWAWNFGDTGTSTLQNPGHTYTAAGTYTVTLTATGPGGSDGETKVGYVVVGEPAPVAEFSGTPLSGSYPLAVTFSDLSTGSVTAWAWNFGDTGTSTLQNPGHTYTAAGTYTVTLTATGPGGSDGETKVGYVVVSEPAPVAEFSGTPLTGTAPLAVTFSDLSSGAVTAWAWNFGDTGTSTLQNPGHTYTTAGTYTVSLTATGPGGSDGETKVGYVVVSAPAPVAEFSGSPLTGTTPLAVTFTDLSTGSVTAWAWNFGDTGTSTLQNPSHTYTAAGTYTVTLTATGPGGSDGETKVGYVVVSDPAPVAEFSGTPLTGTAPLAVTFSDLSTGTVTAWAWNFGDTGTSTLQNPSHTYTTAGTFTVTLTATGPGGSDGETKVGYVVVSEPAPVAEFSGTPLTGTHPLAVTFSDLSTGSVTAWAWNFGDTGTSTLQNPSHTYTAAGTYTVTLTATGPGGSDGETKVGYVVVSEPAPVAEFSGTPLSGTAPLAVTFSDLSTGSVTAWSWNFGDTGTSTLQNPGHTYTAAGTYTVTLTATGPGGSDGETKVGYVVVN